MRSPFTACGREVSPKRALLIELRRRFAYEGKPLLIGLEDLRNTRARIDPLARWSVIAMLKIKKDLRPVMITSRDSIADCARCSVLQWLTESTVHVYALRVDSQHSVG